jgi:hypothetical protein
MENTCSRVFQGYTEGEFINDELLLIDHIRICHFLLGITEDLMEEVHSSIAQNGILFLQAVKGKSFGNDRYNLPPYWTDVWKDLTTALENNYKRRGWECKYVPRPWHAEYDLLSPEQIYEERRGIASECLQKIAQLNKDWPSVAGLASLPSMFPNGLTNVLRQFTDPIPPNIQPPSTSE